MPWTIKADKEFWNNFIFDSVKHELRTRDGELVAAIYEDEKDIFWISLGMNSYFKSDSGITGVGWDGREEHMGDSVYLKSGGGTLFHEKGLNVGKEKGPEFEIRIEYLGISVPKLQNTREKKKGMLSRLFK